MRMAETKTKPTSGSVTEFLTQIEDPQKRTDSKTLIELFSRLTGKKQKMWGRDIIGFGEYHYRYPSGHEGDAPIIGFSPRKAEFSIYLYGTHGETEERSDLLAQLGKHRMGKGCLYVKRLDQVDLGVLKQLAQNSIDTIKSMYPTK
jgi:hypothetical protein